MTNDRESISRTFTTAASISLKSRTQNDQDSPTSESNVKDDLQNSEFASKRWVWLSDKENAFIKGFVVSEDNETGQLKIRCDDGSVSKSYQFIITSLIMLTFFLSTRIVLFLLKMLIESIHQSLTGLKIWLN